MISVELALWLAAAPCESSKITSPRETVAMYCPMPEAQGPFIPPWLKVVLAEAAQAKAQASKPAATKTKATTKKKRRYRRRRR